MIKGTIFAALVLVLSACATGSDLGPSYTYNEIQVINNSKQSIQNLTLSVAGSGEVFSCENIAPLGVCSDRFARRRYKEGAFTIDWAVGGSDRQTIEVGLEVPAYNSPGIPLIVVLDISEQGALSAYFKQITPN